jgi:hypothetical protein
MPAEKEIFLFSEMSKPPVDTIQTCVENVPGALPGRPSVRDVKLIVYLPLVLKLRVCGAIPPFCTYTPSWLAQREVFPVVVHVDTCSSDFIVDVLCEEKETDLRGDYIRPFVRPSVLLYCGPVSRKQAFVKMGAVTAILHVRATIKFDPIFYICQPIWAKFGIKYLHVIIITRKVGSVKC